VRIFGKKQEIKRSPSLEPTETRTTFINAGTQISQGTRTPDKPHSAEQVNADSTPSARFDVPQDFGFNGQEELEVPPNQDVSTLTEIPASERTDSQDGHSVSMDNLSRLVIIYYLSQ